MPQQDTVVRYRAVYLPGAFINARRGHHHPDVIASALDKFKVHQRRTNTEHFVKVIGHDATNGISVTVNVPDDAGRHRSKMEALYEFETFLHRELEGSFDAALREIDPTPSR